MKNIVILGSTGSIGVNALKVISRYPDQFRVVGLTAYNNIHLIEEQVRLFKPDYVVLSEEGITHFKQKRILVDKQILSVFEDLEWLVSLPKVDVVVVAMRGSAALMPFLAAVRAGKQIAPANKEALVIAGDLIMAEAKKFGAKIVPIDSEQSAIFQCLNGQKRSELKMVHLTASGGALLKTPKSKFSTMTVKDILAHPRWKMGRKITVDSAMLMNKGFEVIEAMRLFDLTADQIKVVIHPEAIIHSMVEYCDGSVIAQMGITDMRLPIQYALTYPDRWPTHLKRLDFCSLQQLSFCEPDVQKFPALSLCCHVAKKGGTLPAVLNSADEEAVEAFLHGKIRFDQIYTTVETVVSKHKSIKAPKLRDILSADQWGREATRKVLEKL
ncbi:MAG: 1-deoxy-D-xylulose-5-phosphate reductoisomerase [Candidatus Omnitrophica bacterium]|nr:1-deoxy-D-xylulose-5-phosphate reductoisomerase [Candidatus Omnitrophota bacterium]